MLLVTERRQENEVSVPIPHLAPYSAAELKPIHAWHHPVADDDVHLGVFPVEVPRLLSVSGDEALVPEPLDGAPQDHARDGVVLGDQYLQFRPLNISASSAGRTRPNSASRSPSNCGARERSPEAPASSNCAQRLDILLAPMLPVLPLSVCATRSMAGDSPFSKASSSSSSLERASSRNMPASSATMSVSSSPCSSRSPVSTSRSRTSSSEAGTEGAGVSETHLSSTAPKSSALTGFDT